MMYMRIYIGSVHDVIPDMYSVDALFYFDIFTYVYTYICIYVYICTCVCIDLCTCVCIYPVLGMIAVGSVRALL